jgi:predicted phosphodiesterase
VCISDTHEKLDEILPFIPKGDVLIHAGDFTEYGDVWEVFGQ